MPVTVKGSTFDTWIGNGTRQLVPPAQAADGDLLMLVLADFTPSYGVNNMIRYPAGWTYHGSKVVSDSPDIWTPLNYYAGLQVYTRTKAPGETTYPLASNVQVNCEHNAAILALGSAGAYNGGGLWNTPYGQAVNVPTLVSWGDGGLEIDVYTWRNQGGVYALNASLTPVLFQTQGLNWCMGIGTRDAPAQNVCSTPAPLSMSIPAEIMGGLAACYSFLPTAEGGGGTVDPPPPPRQTYHITWLRKGKV